MTGQKLYVKQLNSDTAQHDIVFGSMECKVMDDINVVAWAYNSVNGRIQLLNHISLPCKFQGSSNLLWKTRLYQTLPSLKLT